MYTLDELKSMVFIDIETTAQTETLQEVLDAKPNLEQYWLEYYEKQSKDIPDLEWDAMYKKMAPLSPEWGKIVCISIGQLKFDETGMPNGFSSKSYYGDDEKELIRDFMKVAGQIMVKKPGVKWVGHYIKGFDIPFIIKRAIINQIPVIRQFHLQKLKPWETCLIDTKEVWQFGNWSGGARLGHITELLDIPTPKDEIMGHQVNGAYWSGRLEEIKTYCEKDIKATGDLMLRLSGIPIVDDVPF